MPTIKKVDAFIKAAKLSLRGDAESLINVNRILNKSINADKKTGTYSPEISLSRKEKKCFG